MICPYAQQVQSVLSDEHTQLLLAIPKKIGLLDFLIQHPYTALRFENRVLYLGNDVSGIYDFQKKEVDIGIRRHPSEYSQTYSKQKFWNISALANTLPQVTEPTFVHELGHHLHGTLRELDLPLFRSTMLTPKSDALSQYGLANSFEYFAECFAANVFQRVELMLDDQFGCAMIERVLDRLELEIKELP